MCVRARVCVRERQGCVHVKMLHDANGHELLDRPLVPPLQTVRMAAALVHPCSAEGQLTPCLILHAHACCAVCLCCCGCGGGCEAVPTAAAKPCMQGTIWPFFIHSGFCFVFFPPIVCLHIECDCALHACSLGDTPTCRQTGRHTDRRVAGAGPSTCCS